MAERTGRSAFDWRAIARAALPPCLYWGAVVVLLAVLGFPGVVCLTPVAWGLAIIVGRDVVVHSRTDDAGRRVREAVVAGALLGAYQGGLFALITALLFPLQPDETTRAVLVDGVAFLGGILVCAGLAYLYSNTFQARLRPQ